LFYFSFISRCATGLKKKVKQKPMHSVSSPNPNSVKTIRREPGDYRKEQIDFIFWSERLRERRIIRMKTGIVMR